MGCDDTPIPQIINHMQSNNNTELDYKEALDFLFSQLPMFSRIGAAAYKPGLDTSLELDRFFNHPHRRFKSIHVGGTNGKGSTSHMLAAILQSKGYKTALYTSPHLVDFRERMRVNGEMIPEEKVIEFVRKWKDSGYAGHPSFFELTMMMAFNWFAEENVDYAVIEVGMGGRLDSTNIITPEVCVITNISNDHTQFLGDTPEKIAAEKAGIIKPGIPVVIGETTDETYQVFLDKAKGVGAPIIFAEERPRILSICPADSAEVPGGGWQGSSAEGEWISPLAGDYQLKNLNTVLNAVDAMREAGIDIDNRSVVKGIEGVEKLTGLAGRWTVLSHSPLTIADTGHNIAGITYNMGQLDRLRGTGSERRTLRIVIGFVADKAIDKILKLLPKDAEYYITNAAIPRALPATELHKRFLDAGLDGRVFPDVKSAYEKVLDESGENDIIFIGGSTFIVADLLASLPR